MGQVSVTLNGRTYRLECGSGEEAHLIELSEYLASHVETMKHKFGQVGHNRLIMMAAVMVTEQPCEAGRHIEEMKTALAESKRDRLTADETVRSLQAELAARVSAAAQRLELLNERFASQAGGVARTATRR